jgi:hypothetical protein
MIETLDKITNNYCILEGMYRSADRECHRLVRELNFRKEAEQNLRADLAQRNAPMTAADKAGTALVVGFIFAVGWAAGCMTWMCKMKFGW